MNVTIEKLIYGGEGLAHADGATVFVPYVLPGEVVTIRPVERKKKFVRGALAQVVTPAPERVAPACPHFTACGGCHYQHIPYEKQLEHKSAILRETLARIGRVPWDGPIQTHASPPLGYRNRAQWKFRAAGTQNILGYNRGGSSAILPIEQCPILAPRLEEAFRALRDAVAAGNFPGTLREIEAFTDAQGDRVLLSASFMQFEGAGRKLVEALRAAVPQAESILLHHSAADRFELDGPGFIHYSAAGHAYRIGHLSFFQVNRFLIDDLVRTVIAGTSGGLAIDLFAGVGLFALPLAKQFARVVAIESNEAAVRDLRATADAAGITLEARAQDVDRYLRSCKNSPDLVVLDPPRAGIGADAAAQLRRISPGRIAYLSCDPATLARDLSALTMACDPGTRYEIRDVHLFDVFPQTFHIETLIHLDRR